MDVSDAFWKLVVFDCDGVIVNSFELVDDILRSVCLEKGIDSYVPIVTLKGLFKERPLLQLGKMGIGRDDIFDPLQARYGETGLFHPVASAIREAKATYPDLPFVVVTSNRQKTVSDRLEHAGLAQHFGQFLGCDTPGLPEDKRDKLRHLLETHNVEPERCCLIGDTRADAKEAKEANIQRVGAAWGYHDADELKPVVDVLLKSPSELRDFLIGSGNSAKA